MSYQNKKVSFLIDHMDSLGQGVSKINDKVTFIAKTLPGESGNAILYKKSKGVNFAFIDNDHSLEKKSDIRITPACSHFYECQGCQYLHCSHEEELQFKKQNLERMMQRLQDNVAVIALANETRFEYRNRIQLHYNLKQKKIGFINKFTKEIHPINNCLLPIPPIKELLKRWYENQEWIALAKGQPFKGHVEIQWSEENLQINWNERYASGGFTQVNEQMNQRMLQLVYELGYESNPNSLLDLFAGNGNLTNRIKEQTNCTRKAIDLYLHQEADEEFFTLNLDNDNALQAFNENHSQEKFDLLVVDPPRKGFKNLHEWCRAFNPQSLVYVSCNPATLVRDLSNLEGYLLDKVYLLDMFPGTYHFETVVRLKKS
jgi:23S rRNA (uracil1939-C5)-methyltransferase